MVWITDHVKFFYNKLLFQTKTTKFLQHFLSWDVKLLVKKGELWLKEC